MAKTSFYPLLGLYGLGPGDWKPCHTFPWISAEAAYPYLAENPEYMTLATRTVSEMLDWFWFTRKVHFRITLNSYAPPPLHPEGDSLDFYFHHIKYPNDRMEDRVIGYNGSDIDYDGQNIRGGGAGLSFRLCSEHQRNVFNNYFDRFYYRSNDDRLLEKYPKMTYPIPVNNSDGVGASWSLSVNWGGESPRPNINGHLYIGLSPDKQTPIPVSLSLPGLPRLILYFGGGIWPVGQTSGSPLFSPVMNW